MRAPTTMAEVKRRRIQPRHGFRCPARMPADCNADGWGAGEQCGDYAGHDDEHTLLIPSGAPWFGRRPARLTHKGGDELAMADDFNGEAREIVAWRSWRTSRRGRK